jgi:hypothetical protein
MLRSMVLAALGLSLALSACGRGGARSGPDSAAPGATCALVTNAADLFGAGFQAVEYGGTDGMAGTCELQSADGARGGDVLTYTAQSLGSVTLDAQLAETRAKWDGQTETALGSVEGLGEQSIIATDLPGYQTHIAFLKDGTLVLIAARSGDDRITGEALARAMAQSVSAAAPADH